MIDEEILRDYERSTLVFIDLGKAYDTIPREVKWGSLEKKQFPCKYIEVIKDTYNGAITSVKTIEVQVQS